MLDLEYIQIGGLLYLNIETGKEKIERKHLSLRTWCARLVRKGIRFSKTEQMHKIVVGLVINVWFFARISIIQ